LTTKFLWGDLGTSPHNSSAVKVIAPIAPHGVGAYARPWYLQCYIWSLCCNVTRVEFAILLQGAYSRSLLYCHAKFNRNPGRTLSILHADRQTKNIITQIRQRCQWQ